VWKGREEEGKGRERRGEDGREERNALFGFLFIGLAMEGIEHIVCMYINIISQKRKYRTSTRSGKIDSESGDSDFSNSQEDLRDSSHSSVEFGGASSQSSRKNGMKYSDVICPARRRSPGLLLWLWLMLVVLIFLFNFFVFVFLAVDFFFFFLFLFF
jgi:hypothetical protein